MTEAQVHLLLEESFNELQRSDNLILERKPKEECINHRFAVYLEHFFPLIIHDEMLYKVDIEYDRHLAEKNKEIEIAPDVYLSIRPDIIIHKREDDRHNLIAIEAKYDSLTKHDYLKLEKLLRPPYNYTFTVGVSYSPKTNHFRYSLLTLMEDVVLVIKTKLKKED